MRHIGEQKRKEIYKNSVLISEANVSRIFQMKLTLCIAEVFAAN